MPKSYRFSDLTEGEQRTLEQIYGPQTKDLAGFAVRQIDCLRELTEGEAWFFRRSHFVSPHFCVQTLYKRKGKPNPMQFNRTLLRFIEQSEYLQSNYCSLKDRTLRVVIKERREFPEIVYRNLENVDKDELDEVLQRIMEADMRKSFDLQRGILIRFTVLSTSKDECAVLVAMPQLIAGGVDIRAMFRSLGGDDAPPVEPMAMNAMRPPAGIEASMRNYWEKVLADLPPAPDIPFAKAPGGSYQQTSYRITLPADFNQELRRHAKSNRIMLMAILQTAWGILLQEHNRNADVAFCLLAPVRSNQAGGMSFNMMPARVQASEDATVEKNVERQFQQLVISQPYSCFGWEELPLLAERKDQRPFNHFLSFYDLVDEPKSYAKAKATPDGTIIMQNSWDARGMRMGIYFHCGERTISVSLLYDGNQFLSEAGKSIAERYRLVLQQMLTDWNLPFREFSERLSKRLALSTETQAKRDGDTKAQMRQFASQLKILQGTIEGTISQIVAAASFVTLFEGDRISGDDMEKHLYFVVEGKLARSIEASDGWYNTLDIMKKNAWLNESALLPKRKAHLSAEVLTEQALLLTIPMEEMKKLLSVRPELWKNFALYATEQMERYQRLWVQA